MDLTEAKERLEAIEGELAGAPFVEFYAFMREGRTLHLAVTDRLRKAVRKEGVWRSREMLAVLKNAAPDPIPTANQFVVALIGSAAGPVRLLILFGGGSDTT